VKTLYFIFIVSLFSCSSKDNIAEINNLKDISITLSDNNSRLCRIIEKEIIEEGSRPKDLIYLNKSKEIINKQKSITNKEKFLESYLKFLKSEFKIVEEKDTSRLYRAEKLISKFNKNRDSLLFYNSYLNLLMIENDILKSISMRVGSSCRWFNHYSNIYKEKDTISRNETYSFVVIPDILCHKKNDIKMDFHLNILRNNKIETIPIISENIGGLVTIKIKPEMPGNYKINGELIIKSTRIDFSLKNIFVDNFYVKE
jgi:hypothetical protein